MFRALSLLALVSVALATPSIPRTLLLSRQLSGSSGSDCSSTCTNVSDVLESCTSATECCSDSTISDVVSCIDCGVSAGVETESDGQDVLDQYSQACSSLGVDTGSLTVGSGSASASATAAPTFSASSATAAGASSITRSADASSAVFTPATALSSLEASASAAESSIRASASQTASAASSSATDSGINIPGTAGSGAAGLSAPASVVLTAAIGVVAAFLA
ncbi:unnamed protein product [Peniophora sp. CBMAI 1063]|nr:unnamed protein product [Peniophora sp. CBMAI 1063]